MRFSLVVALTASASLASAVPFDWSGDDSNIVDSHSWGACKRRCSLSKATLPVVPGINFTTPAPDVAKHPRAIGLGVGVQNYTCTAAGAYATLGAVARLFNISCFQHSPSFNNLSTIALGLQQQNLLNLTALKHLAFGHHYFVNFNHTLSPRFDISKQKDPPPSQFVIAKKIADFKAPVDPAHKVDWLQLSRVSGDFAKLVYRIETAGGQPPTTCTPGSGNISVPYAAQYWFFD